MTRTAALGWGAVILVTVVALGQGSHQDWELQRGGNWDTVRFSVRRFEAGHGRWNTSFNAPMSRFHGITYDNFSQSGKVKFEYVQDAGKLVCDGRFLWGRGSGSFTFVPNPDFANELKKLGYNAPREDKLFSMAISGINLDYAREMKAAGLDASVEELSELRDQGITLDYIRDVRLEGYRDLTVRDLVDLHNQGVGIKFLRAAKDAGYNLRVHEIINLSQQGIDGGYMRDIQAAGLHPTAAELIEYHQQGVSAKFLDRLKAAGYDKLTTSQIVQLHQNGISPDFVDACKELGYAFTTGELVELHNNGVDAHYLRKLKDSGMRTLSAEEITRLHQNGVD
jgi:hypothetical protein